MTKLHVLPRRKDGIVRGRIKVAGVNIDISGEMPLSEFLKTSNQVYWLECAKMQLIATAGDYESEYME